MILNIDDKIIGGMFGLPDTVEPKVAILSHRWKFLDESSLFLANGRSGIIVLIDRLKTSGVWMPSYLCPTMIESVDQKKTNVRFYEVDCNLCISSTNWVDQIQSGDLVVLIDYFGFPMDSKVATLAKKQGAWILEDACQALLSEHVGQYSDFILFSPRKFIGVPDGGVLVSCCDITFDDIELKHVPTYWWLKMLEAVINRREFDLYGGKRRWYQLFRETGTTTPCGYFAMSDLSKKLLFNCFDYSKIAQQRIENYSVLAHRLKNIALFDSLPKGTVPLGFPVIHKQRDRIRESLFQKQIYPPVHWPIKGIVPGQFIESHRLANNIMTLPCDQRYAPSQAQFIASTFLEIMET